MGCADFAPARQNTSGPFGKPQLFIRTGAYLEYSTSHCREAAGGRLSIERAARKSTT
jgi:hypothetical protein